MLDNTIKLLKEQFHINNNVLELSQQALKDVSGEFQNLDYIKEYNQLKVLKAMQEERVSDIHFTNSTGYGYGDIGRDTLEKVYSRVFNCEDALVRPQIVSGTQALTLALSGNLRPGDTLMSITGTPYDTLLKVRGIDSSDGDIGSLRDFGVKYRQIELTKEGTIDIPKVVEALKEDPSIRMLEIQRSTGYGWRPSLTIEGIRKTIEAVKAVRQDVICFVDNCYGEFIDIQEPTDVGADLMAGSLIKNAGGGIAPTGGYVAGKAKYVQQAAYRLTAPGLGKECGSTFGVMRLMFQGFFMAPHITCEALKSAIFCSRLMELAGYEVSPCYKDKRSDIIQAIKFGTPDDLINFIKGIQHGSPVDSFAECEPWDMPGYSDPVIMAAGAFVQGSSIELSADAPIREPYIAYLQGGLTFEHAKTRIMIGLSRLMK